MQPFGLSGRGAVSDGGVSALVAASGILQLRARADLRQSPGRNGIRRCPEWAEPEVDFRKVHVALDDGFPPTDASPPPSYREQTVDIALGPNAAFQGGSIGTLTRRVPPSQFVKAVPPSRRKARPRRSAHPASSRLSARPSSGDASSTPVTFPAKPPSPAGRASAGPGSRRS
jgi:hypothetical protein